jgi:hypothetical protein
MYETLEHWKQYKQEKELQTKISKEFKLPVNDNSFMLNDNSSKLNEMLTHPYIVESNDLANEVLNKEDKAKYFKEFDKWLNKLIKKNGVTKY